MNDNTLALVTGSSSGIGKACATLLLERGWDVIGYSRRAGNIQHPQYTHVQLDLSNLADMEAHFTPTIANPLYTSKPRRVGLVNNAAVLTPVGTLENAPLADLERCYRLNVLAPLWLTHRWLPKAFPQATLRVVHVSSGAANRAVSGWGAYCSSKAALLMAGRVWGEDSTHNLLKHGNMQVTSYGPGVVDTEMQARIRSQKPQNFPDMDRFLSLYKHGQLAPPSTPGKKIVALLEGDAGQAYQEETQHIVR